MPQQTLSIIGLGLIGGSVGLAVKKHLTYFTVVGYDHESDAVRQSLTRAAIDRAAVSLDDAIAAADRILICVPPSSTEPVLKAIARNARPGTQVSDVLSTKRVIHRHAEAILPTIDFVGSHPIAGSEKIGIQHADDRLLAGALCVITSVGSVANRSTAGWIEFWEALGLRTATMSADEHDRRFAVVSHLPHALASALMNSTDLDSLPLAGKGFTDTTRIAAGSPELWRDILIENADNVRDGLLKLSDKLRQLADLIDPAKSDELLAYLTSAAERRRALASRPPT